MESLDHFRIELATGPVVQLLRCGFVRLAESIHAIARDRVERVSHGKDAGVYVDLLVTPPDCITGAVPLLVMLGHDARRALEKLDAAQDLLAMQRMFAHEHPLFFSELRGLAQD